MNKHKSMFYATIGEFANCGSIFDFLKENNNFLAFVDLKSRFRKDVKKTTLQIYKNNKLEEKIALLTLPSDIPEFLSPLQHMVFFLNILQALRISYFKNERKSIDVALTTFSVIALATVLAKKLNYCKKTLLHHWDYMPFPENTQHGLLLKLVDPLDHLVINKCDYVWYASQNQFDIRIKIGQIDDASNFKHKVVHWGNNSKLSAPKKPNSEKLKLLYMGSLLPEKGLMEVLKSMPRLVQVTKGDIILAIVGSANNPEYGEILEDYVNSKSLQKYVSFPGYAKGDVKESLLLENDLSIALYPEVIDGVKNYAYYSDPAKLRDYISYGLPILVTKVPEIHKDLVKYDAGIVVNELTPDSISAAVEKFILNKNIYLEGAYTYSKVDNYSEYYSRLFNSLT